MPPRVTTKAVKAKLVKGQLVPDPSTIRAVMKDLRSRAAKDPSIGRAWRRNPRAVLSGLGFGTLVQNEILAEEGKPVRWSPSDKVLASGCYGCSGCCCSGCSWSG